MKRLLAFLDKQNPYLLLAISICVEVTGACSLKMSEGFAHPAWSCVTLVCYAISLSLLTVLLKHLPLGLTYGIWGGAGAALTTIAGIIIWGDAASAATFAGVALIVGGIVLLCRSDEGEGTSEAGA